MRRLLLAIAAAALAATLVATTVLADQTQTLDANVTPARKGKKRKPRNVALELTTATGTTDNSKPSPSRRAQLLLPRGMRLNPGRFPTCQQATVESNQVGNCPRRSVVGSGTATIDARPVVGDPVPATVTVVNCNPTDAPRLCVHLKPETGQPVTMVATIRSAVAPFGRLLDLEIPVLDTVPGSPPATLTQLQMRIRGTNRRRVRRRTRTYRFVEAPTSCPRTGWPFQGTFAYEDGTSLTASDSVACR